MSTLWLPIAAFFATSALGLVLAILFTRSGRNRDHEVLASGRRRPLLFGALTSALAGTIPSGQPAREQLSKFLRHAGHYHRQALAEYLALRNALTLGWLLLTVAAIALATEPGDGRLVPIAVFGGIGAMILYSLPRLVLEVMAKGRVQRIEEALPDALDMISMCMAGGLPLQASLVRVSDEIQSTHGDLAFELRVVGRQMDAGSLDGAVKQFANRLDAPEIHSLASIVAQTEQQGSGVARAFQIFSDNVRLNRRQRAEEMGNKTAVKLLFPLVFCLAPPVYLMLMAPAAIEIGDFIKRENQPGGSLAAAENARPLLNDSRSQSQTVVSNRGHGPSAQGSSGPQPESSR